MTASHTLTPQELSLNIITALMKSFDLEGKVLVPDCWINGFGQVIQVDDVHDDTGEVWEFALNLDGKSSNHVLKSHPIDRHYRGNDPHPDCYHDDRQFFPFR
jgi:hypothetical protein